MPRRSIANRRTRAFTLVELLIVVAIIAILVAILSPALSKARAIARTAACSINCKSIAQALNVYANDYKDRIWETGNGTPRRLWYGRPRDASRAAGPDNPWVLGPAFEYLSHVDRVFECPTNKRRAKVTYTMNPNDPFWNRPENLPQRELLGQFLSDRNMNFDYTMATGVSGAKIGNFVSVAWDSACRTRTPATIPAAPVEANLRIFPGVPIYVEEDTRWYNAEYPDGMFSNKDQMTTRHERGGHMAMLGGEAYYMQPSRGPSPDAEDMGDMTGNDFWASTRTGRWFRLAPSWPDTPRPWGWLDSPRAP